MEDAGYGSDALEEAYEHLDLESHPRLDPNPFARLHNAAQRVPLSGQKPAHRGCAAAGNGQAKDEHDGANRRRRPGSGASAPVAACIELVKVLRVFAGAVAQLALRAAVAYSAVSAARMARVGTAVAGRPTTMLPATPRFQCGRRMAPVAALEIERRHACVGGGAPDASHLVARRALGRGFGRG